MLELIIYSFFWVFALFGIYRFIIFLINIKEEYDHVLQKEKLITGLSLRKENKLPPIYLKGEDIQFLTILFSNAAPVINGYTHSAIRYSYPGYEYTLYSYLLSNHLIVDLEKGGKGTNPKLFFYKGVLLDGYGSFSFDDGNLVHEAKTNYRGLSGDPSWWNRYKEIDNNSTEKNEKDNK